MSTPQTTAAIIVAFISSFFWCKIYIQNLLGFGKNRKVSPEDKEIFKMQNSEDNEQGNDEEEFTWRDRITNINNNDKENIPYTLFIMWGTLIIGDELSCQILIYASIAYTVFRLLHSISYLCGWNSKPIPMRTTSFQFAQVSAIIIMIFLPVGAVTRFA